MYVNYFSVLRFSSISYGTIPPFHLTDSKLLIADIVAEYSVV